jgi:hypothetical protein
MIGAVVHLGASLAVEANGPSGRALINSRVAMTSLPPNVSAPIASVVESIGLALQSSCTRWACEGEAWSRLDRPLLSFTGAGPDFHTPNDTADRVTSPAALAYVSDAVAAAAVEMVTTCRSLAL